MSDPIFWAAVAGAVVFSWLNGYSVMSMGSIGHSYALHWGLGLTMLGSIGVAIWREGWVGALTLIPAWLFVRQGGFAAMRAYKKATGSLHPHASEQEKVAVFESAYRQARDDGRNNYEATMIAQSKSGYYGDYIERARRIDEGL